MSAALPLHAVSGTDPLNDSDARHAAEHAHLEALLRCWLVETHTPVHPGPLRIALPGTGLALVTEVNHCSPSGWHRFGPVRLEGPGGTSSSADPVLAVALVAHEAVRRGGARRGGVPAGQLADLVERTAESVRRVAEFVAHRRARPLPPPPVDGFLDAEQALLLGHLHHPAPKSRDGLSDTDTADFSPELRGSFRLHWFAADPSVVSHDAVQGSLSLSGRDTVALMADLAERPLDDGRVRTPRRQGVTDAKFLETASLQGVPQLVDRFLLCREDHPVDRNFLDHTRRKVNQAHERRGPSAHRSHHQICPLTDRLLERSAVPPLEIQGDAQVLRDHHAVGRDRDGTASISEELRHRRTLMESQFVVDEHRSTRQNLAVENVSNTHHTL